MKLKLTDIYRVQVAIFMRKFKDNELPITFVNFFIPVRGAHHHNTRNVLLYKIPLYKTKLGGLFIKKTGIQIWADTVHMSTDKKVTDRLIKRMLIADTCNKY